LEIDRTTVKDDTRSGELIKNIRYTIYEWISRGLFVRHTQIFLTLITFRLMQKKVIDVTYETAEMEFLIKSTAKPGTENNLDWLPTASWDKI
jgi:dynein heavy chain